MFGCTKKVNILSDTESKTNCSNGKYVWKKIYSHTDSKLIYQMISGIHFSINVHISYNYYNLGFFYYHNLGNYIKNRKYYSNFMLLFVFIRNKLKHKNSFYAKKYKYDENIDYAYSFNKMLQEIGCLDCDKCKTFGTLYFKGLFCILSNKCTKEDKLIIILFYKKMLETIKMMYFLERLI